MAALSTIGAVAGIASAGVGIASGIKSLTSKPKTPQIAGGSGAESMQLGFKNPLTTPGYSFKGGELTTSPLGETYADTLGGFLVGGGLNALRGRQVGTIGQLAPIRAGLGAGLTNIADLRAQVKPGFGALTDAKVTAIRDAAAESIGNLRDSLARRGVMGSSFADDAVSRTRVAFAREEANARAEAKVAEIGVQSELIGQELQTFAQMFGLTQFEASAYQQDIANAVLQTNLISQELTRQLQEFGVAGNIANSVSAQVTQQAIAQAQLQLLSQVQSGKDSAGGIAAITGGLKSLSKIDWSTFNRGPGSGYADGAPDMV